MRGFSKLSDTTNPSESTISLTKLRPTCESQQVVHELSCGRSDGFRVQSRCLTLIDRQCSTNCSVEARKDSGHSRAKNVDIDDLSVALKLEAPAVTDLRTYFPQIFGRSVFGGSYIAIATHWARTVPSHSEVTSQSYLQHLRILETSYCRPTEMISLYLQSFPMVYHIS